MVNAIVIVIIIIAAKANVNVVVVDVVVDGVIGFVVGIVVVAVVFVVIVVVGVVVKKVVLYIAVSSPLDRSKRFTLVALPGRTVHSDTNSASPGSILARQQLRAKTKSLTFPPLSIARYSFIQLSQQGRQWSERKCPIYETVPKGDSNPVSRFECVSGLSEDIQTETDRQKDIQTDIQTDRQTAIHKENYSIILYCC